MNALLWKIEQLFSATPFEKNGKGRKAKLALTPILSNNWQSIGRMFLFFD
jgi:hypothetical protein